MLVIDKSSKTNENIFWSKWLTLFVTMRRQGENKAVFLSHHRQPSDVPSLNRKMSLYEYTMRRLKREMLFYVRAFDIAWIKEVKRFSRIQWSGHMFFYVLVQHTSEHKSSGFLKEFSSVSPRSYFLKQNVTISTKLRVRLARDKFPKKSDENLMILVVCDDEKQCNLKYFAPTLFVIPYNNF